MAKAIATATMTKGLKLPAFFIWLICDAFRVREVCAKAGSKYRQKPLKAFSKCSRVHRVYFYPTPPVDLDGKLRSQSFSHGHSDLLKFNSRLRVSVGFSPTSPKGKQKLQPISIARRI
jgi:hypothetical protein